jgi:hypothetical protein
MKHNSSEPLVAPELHIVDGDGRRRLSLSAVSGSPSIQMFAPDGRPSFAVSLDTAGRAALRLGNADDSGPTAVLEVVETGTHVKFVRPGGGASYLFLNNAGGSGVVLIDANGTRRLVALAPADGSVKIEKYDADGKLLP